MKRYKLKMFIIASLVILSGFSFGQSVNTNSGTDFWFGFTGDSDGPSGGGGASYSVNITSFFNTTGTITVPGALWSQTFTVSPGVTTTVVIPAADVDLDAEGMKNVAVHVTSVKNITLYYTEASSGPRNDNTYVLPDTLLGNDYSVMSYALNGSSNGGSHPSYSEFMIVTPNNAVRVKITPSNNTKGGHLQGVTYDTTIYPGQVYQVQGQVVGNTNSDLTGTRITAFNTSDPTQKFAVFGAMDIGSATCNGTVDGVFEQLMPVYTWGENYIFITTPDAQDICRVLALQAGTQVNFNGHLQTTLGAGQYYDTLVSPGAPVYITANNPISVARILQTESCNNDPLNVGDPSLAVVQPTEDMYLDSVTFYADLTNGVQYNYVQVITRTSDVNTIFLDGTNIGSTFIPLPGNPAYSYDSVSITPTAHKLTTTSCGFLAYFTGMGSVTSSATAAGVFLRYTSGGKASAVSTPSTCSGGCIGTATATVIGGVQPYTYLWSDASSQTTQTATGLCPGTYTCVVQEACDASIDTAIVSVQGSIGAPLSVTITGATSLCSGATTTLCATAIGGTNGIIYSWQPGNFSTPCITVSPTSTTVYTVSVADNCGTTATTTATVLVNPLPTVNFNANLYQGCAPLCIQFYNTTTLAQGGPAQYVWTFGNGDSSHVQSPVYCYPSSGKYDVTLTVISDSGCSSTLKKINMITAYERPNAAFTVSPQPANILDPTIQFTNKSTDSYNIISWSWNFGDATDSTSNSENTSHTYQDTGTYCANLIVVDEHGCNDTATNCLVIEPAFNLYIPSAFTPNGDGLNDVFKPAGQYVKTFEMYIFDRWGVQLFHSTDINDGWNGTVNGGSVIAQQDTYEYKILVTDYSNNQHTYVGNVTLLK